MPKKPMDDFAKAPDWRVSATSSDEGSWLREGLATDQAIRAITAKITSGEIGPGQRLPTERDLASSIGLSRSTVREAVRGLELMGVLDVRRGAGTYVTSLEPKLLLQATAFATRLFGDDRVFEVFDVRSVLEGAASSAAAARVTDAQLGDLKRLLDVLCASSTPVALLDADVAFHNYIANCSGNELLSSLVHAFGARTYRARFWQSLVLDDELMRSMRAAHDRIYRAIAMRNPAAAAAAASAHILETAMALQRMGQEIGEVTGPTG